ncbi:hypothetical protein J2128_001381 [Methanomicrobium sp. W14]|uniref:hypothetical protein n=1 Tax=Methanomicrobium sp. W14 TaxID=2817839 RepID=UPI001AE86921|nr:hypothetical protein [Methanomicrobium sp. W14]MBP2133427.1 hypothetical protein [Methanomicrobium sp. W14]
MGKNLPDAGLDEDMSGMVFDGVRYEIPDLDQVFYAVYKRGISSRDDLKEELLSRVKKAGVKVPEGKEEDFGYALAKKYKMTMDRGSPMDFY